MRAAIGEDNAACAIHTDSTSSMPAFSRTRDILYGVGIQFTHELRHADAKLTSKRLIDLDECERSRKALAELCRITGLGRDFLQRKRRLAQSGELRDEAAPFLRCQL